MKTTLNKTAAITTTEKYTEAQTKSLLQAWQEFTLNTPQWANADRSKTDDFIKALAVQYAKTVKSIVGKLTRHNVYIAKTAAKKSAAGTQTKVEYAEAIGKVLLLTDAETQSLEVAGKGALKKIFEALVNSKPMEVLTPEQMEEKTVLIDGMAEIIAMDGNCLQDLTNLKLSTITDIYGELKDKVSEFENLQAFSKQNPIN